VVFLIGFATEHKDACLQLGNAGCQLGLVSLSPVLSLAGWPFPVDHLFLAG
jgi:hypothetical protein